MMRSTRVVSWGMIVALGAAAVFAQTQGARPAFEAASVKVNNSGSRSSSSDGSRGQVLMTNMTLRRLIERAYNVKPYQVTGPDWMEDVRCDIAAKYPPDIKNDDRPVMLRTLLEDRFKLATHRETKDLPGYALVVVKSGFKLKPVEPGDYHISHTGGPPEVLTAKKTSMANLAEHMARIVGQTLVDKTGIDGVYDFDFHWTVEDTGTTDRDFAAATLVNALQDALGSIGLRLRPEKVPVEVVVVDHLERVPTEN